MGTSPVDVRGGWLPKFNPSRALGPSISVKSWLALGMAGIVPDISGMPVVPGIV
jgi:hypothetical protein